MGFWEHQEGWLGGSTFIRNWIAAVSWLAWMLLGTSLPLPIAFVQAAESPALERVNLGFSAAGSVATAPLWMAQDSGAFKKYGLDVN